MTSSCNFQDAFYIKKLENENAILQEEIKKLTGERERFLIDKRVGALMDKHDSVAADYEDFYLSTGIRFKGNYFLLMEFTDNASPPGSKNECHGWEELNSSFYYILQDIILTAFRNRHIAATCNQSGRIQCVVNIQCPSESISSAEYVRQDMPDIIQSINNRLHAEHGFRFFVSVSRLYASIDKLQNALQDINALRDYRLIMGDSTDMTLFYEDVNHSSKLTDRATFRESEDLFVDHIHRGDFKSAKDIFLNDIAKDFLTHPPSLAMARFRMFGLIDYLVHTLHITGVELGIEDRLEAIHFTDRLLGAQNIDEVRQQMSLILDDLEDYYNKHNNWDLSKVIKLYIEDNYTDDNLNVNTVADHFNISASHLTRVFKAQFNVRVLDYIHRVRLRAAKKLLGTGKSVREIAEETGYGSSVNMIRAFKRMEGTTPGDYIGRV